MDNNSVIFKTVLYVDEKVVAESDDLLLWQKTLSNIKNSNVAASDTREIFVESESIECSHPRTENITELDKFSKEMEIDSTLLNDACSFQLEAPYIKLDMKTWENYKTKHFENKKPLPDVVIVGTILVLWKKNAGLGDATHKEVLNILKQLNLTAKNAKRSYNNCAWLKLDGAKVIILATKYSSAKKVLSDYCNCL